VGRSRARAAATGWAPGSRVDAVLGLLDLVARCEGPHPACVGPPATILLTWVLAQKIVRDAVQPRTRVRISKVVLIALGECSDERLAGQLLSKRPFNTPAQKLRDRIVVPIKHPSETRRIFQRTCDQVRVGDHSV
jgi:hypothetical protein